MDAKRHHYVPKFLLRRFSCEPTAEDPLIWRLDKESGRTAWASIKNETVIGHYYRLEAPKKLSPTAVEKYFSDVEGAAATAIRELVAGGPVSGDELGELALFVWVQYARSPLVRTWMTHAREVAAQAELISKLNDRDFVAEHYREWDDSLTAEEAESFRQELLGGLLDGAWIAQVPHDSEVLGILAGIEKGVSVVARQMSWYGLRAPQGTEFMLSDHPLAIHDPAAEPDEPVGWLSSPTVEVTLPIDPSLCLLMKPGPSGYREGETDAAQVQLINLRTYAWGHWAIYGPSEGVVRAVHDDAERRGGMVASFAPRAPHLLIAEHQKGSTRPFRVSVLRPPSRGSRSRRARRR